MAQNAYTDDHVVLPFQQAVTSTYFEDTEQNIDPDIASAIFSNDNSLLAAQKQPIKDLIAEGEADIKSDQEIFRAQAVVEDLIAKRQARPNQINTYHGALSPALKLPYELVREILLLVYGDGNKIRSSVHFSHICRAWRDISLSTPHLWTYIVVSVKEGEFIDKMSLLKTFCQRSSGLPLSVTIAYETRIPEHLLDENILVQVLSPYVNQIRSLSLTIPERHLIAFLCLPGDSFSQLEKFSFSYPSTFYTQGSGSSERLRLLPIDLSAFAPHLSRLTWNAFLPAETILRVPTNIIELTYSGLSCAQCLRLFPQTPNLTSFDLSIFSWHRPVPHAQPPLTVLQQLQSITLITFDSVLRDGEIFNCITAPALRSLDLFSNRGCWPMSSFSSFLNRSSCMVTRLRLGEFVMSRRYFLKCLRLLPSIIELQLDEYPFTDALNNLVWSSGRQNNLLPNLQYLRVHATESPQYKLLDVIRSRWWSDEDESINIGTPSRLKMCRLRHFYEVKEEVLLPLKALHDEGLDIDIVSGSGLSSITDWDSDR